MKEEVTITPTAVDTAGAALYTGFSESFLRKARMEGGLPNRTPGPHFVKIGSKIIYLIKDLDNWLIKHRRVS